MAMNYTNNNYTVISDKRSIPFNSPLTGTISTIGNVVIGVGTKFRTELPVGSWLLDLPNWELRKVMRVDDDFRVDLDHAFTADMAALTVGQAIHYDIANAIEISIEVIASNPPAVLNNASFSGILTLSKASSTRSGNNDRVDPILVDASATEMKVEVIY